MIYFAQIIWFILFLILIFIISNIIILSNVNIKNTFGGNSSNYSNKRPLHSDLYPSDKHILKKRPLHSESDVYAKKATSTQ